MKRHEPKIGDVYEVSTPKGLAYIQFTHLTPQDAFPIIRVLPGLYSSRPKGITDLVKRRELYFAFYVLPYAVKAGQVIFLRNEPIPSWAKDFPLMRRSANIEGKPSWLIGPASTPGTLEGMRTMTRVSRLTRDQRKLSMYDSILSHQGMVDQIVRGWTPERDEELNALARAENQALVGNETSLQSRGEYLDHFLYFSRESDAQEAAKRLRAKGWFAEVRRGADERNWLALAKQPAPISEDIGEIRDELEALANELHGEYDGWGAAI